VTAGRPVCLESVDACGVQYAASERLSVAGLAAVNAPKRLQLVGAGALLIRDQFQADPPLSNPRVFGVLLSLDGTALWIDAGAQILDAAHAAERTNAKRLAAP